VAGQAGVATAALATALAALGAMATSTIYVGSLAAANDAPEVRASVRQARSASVRQPCSASYFGGAGGRRRDLAGQCALDARHGLGGARGPVRPLALRCRRVCAARPRWYGRPRVATDSMQPLGVTAPADGAVARAGFIALMGAFALARNVHRTLVQWVPKLGTIATPFHLRLTHGAEGTRAGRVGSERGRGVLMDGQKRRGGLAYLDERFDAVYLVVLAASLGVAGAYLTWKPWPLTNLLSISLALHTLRLLRLDGFATGMVLLSGLFVYDVVWVFGTDVMVTVARGFEAPIKIVFPTGPLWAADPKLSMLGLGDIIVPGPPATPPPAPPASGRANACGSGAPGLGAALPGIFIVLALRFDRRHLTTAGAHAYAKPYFTATLVAYVLGLLTTFGVLLTFRAAQVRQRSPQRRARVCRAHLTVPHGSRRSCTSAPRASWQCWAPASSAASSPRCGPLAVRPRTTVRPPPPLASRPRRPRLLLLLLHMIRHRRHRRLPRPYDSGPPGAIRAERLGVCLCLCMCGIAHNTWRWSQLGSRHGQAAAAQEGVGPGLAAQEAAQHIAGVDRPAYARRTPPQPPPSTSELGNDRQDLFPSTAPGEADRARGYSGGSRARPPRSRYPRA
jgi:hypothetical protein